MRVEIASIYFYCGMRVSWRLVRFVMLIIFAKYGRPMEDDEKTLIENKLTEQYLESIDEELKHARKV